MTWRHRLQLLDSRSGVAQIQLDLVELLAPLYALVAVTCTELAAWQATGHNWGVAVTLVAVAVVLALVAVAGYRSRRLRAGHEDRWRTQ